MTEISAAQSSPVDNRWLAPLAIGAYFAVLKLFLHFTFNGNYGYFRDELYFMACGEHLAWGYPDHAPMVALMAKASREILGDSLFAIRFFPAVAGAVKVFLTALLVKEFGGNRFAAFLACLCVLLAPIYLGIDNLLSMNSLEPVFWTGCVYWLVLARRRNDSRYLILFGAFAGLGLMNKHSMLFFGASIAAGLIFTSARKVFLDKYLYIAGLLSLLIFLPNIIWEYQNDWATLELLQNVQKTGKNVEFSTPKFLLQQILMLSPISFPIWIAGLWFLLFDKDAGKFRFLGIAYIVFLLLMIFLKAKDYYAAPIYPMLFAAGAVWWEDIIRARALPFLKYALPLLILITGFFLMPMVLPVLPIETYIAYQEKLGLKPPKAEVSHEGVLPQLYGDQFGWREMVEKVSDVYHGLPPEERAKVGIFASNYGEAGAIDFFGTEYGLPKAVSPHQSYYLWGPREYTGELLIVLGSDREGIERGCEKFEEKATVGHPLAMREENFTIYLCQTKKPLPEIWSSLKIWN
ncbi:MAG: glycosyltransferase family 39 protein [Acidobacteriota bacterium]|nr:glycosyltransferase family 39 protein [Acidobacteriota bacterium]